MSKKNKQSVDDYAVTVAWSERDECFVARVPAFPGVAADGESPEEAVAEVRVALRLAMDVMEEHGDALPEADQTLQQVRAMLPLINLSKLARLSKINRQTLTSKLERGTRFSPVEAQRIHQALDGVLA